MDGNCPFSKGKTPTRAEDEMGITVSYRCDMTGCELWEWGKNRCKLYAAAEAIEGIYQVLSNWQYRSLYQDSIPEPRFNVRPHSEPISTKKNKGMKGVEL